MMGWLGIDAVAAERFGRISVMCRCPFIALEGGVHLEAIFDKDQSR